MLDAFGFADHFLSIDFLFQDLGLADQRGLVRRIFQGDENPVQIQRLLDEVEGPFLDAGNGNIDVRMAGNHDHRAFHSVPQQGFQDFDAVHAGHFDVAENGIEFFLFGFFNAFGAVLGGLDLVLFHLQDFLEGVADGPLVVNNQNSHTANIAKIFYICHLDVFAYEHS